MKLGKRKIGISLLALVVTLGIFAIAHNVNAHGSYLTDYNTTFSTNAGCGLCHIDPNGGGPLTPTTGTTFKNSGHNVCSIGPSNVGNKCAPPVINSFTANPTSINSGGSSTLSWGLTGGTPTALIIDNGVGSVLGSSSKAVSPTATTNYTLTASNIFKTATQTVTKQVQVAVTVPRVLTTINVAPTAASIEVGATQLFTATALDQNGAAFAGATITWSSSNSTVATVNATGLVTGVSAGTATVTATATSGATTKKGTSAITVNAVASTPVLTTITVAPTAASIGVGTTQLFTATALDQNSVALVTQPTFTWTSSNTAIAKVDATGLATGIAAGGQVTITATSGTIKGTASVTVSNTTTGPDLSIWVGQWFKVAIKYDGYGYGQSSHESLNQRLGQDSPGMAKDHETIAAYLKLASWDPNQAALQGSLWQVDSASGQWVSDPLTLHLIGGTSKDFLSWAQVNGDFTSGFVVRVRARGYDDTLKGATVKTLGGYFFEINKGASSSSQSMAGGSISIGGSLVSESDVPVPK